VACGAKAASVGTEGNAVYAIAVAAENVQLTGGGDLPEAHRAIVAG